MLDFKFDEKMDDEFFTNYFAVRGRLAKSVHDFLKECLHPCPERHSNDCPVCRKWNAYDILFDQVSPSHQTDAAEAAVRESVTEKPGNLWNNSDVSTVDVNRIRVNSEKIAGVVAVTHKVSVGDIVETVGYGVIPVTGLVENITHKAIYIRNLKGKRYWAKKHLVRVNPHYNSLTSKKEFIDAMPPEGDTTHGKVWYAVTSNDNCILDKNY